LAARSVDVFGLTIFIDRLYFFVNNEISLGYLGCGGSGLSVLPFASATAIGPIEVPKASDLLAARLREQILDGSLAEGLPLPTERELGVRTGLGRSSVREALRILENQGFITTRAGRNGGSTVRRPQRSSVAASLENFIRGWQLSLISLLETRQAVEPAAARLAARHREHADLIMLDRVSGEHEAAFGDSSTFLQINVDWHMAVVAASHNELLIAFMTAIARAVYAATEFENLNSDQIRRATLHGHRRVVDAIRERDEAAAERRMRRHLDAYVDILRKSTPPAPAQGSD
jgi:GntR family transcriptional regulator, transcriptional repressor for pyruvate dehydrogenase complex